MLSSLLIPAEMVDTGQRTVIPVLADAGTAPGLGVQAARVAPISWVRMLDAISIDGLDHWLGWSPMTPVGCSPGGLVLSMMLVSFPPS